MKAHVIIPAAGTGNRFGQDVPKQFSRIGDQTILEKTISIFLSSPYISRVIVTCAEKCPYVAQLNLDPCVEIVVGGPSRSHSVLSGLNALEQEHACDWVLVHDAARPCLEQDSLSDLILFVQKHEKPALLATPITSTLKRVKDFAVLESVDRGSIWAAQTPQIARVKELKAAIEDAHANGIEITDEASALERLGIEVLVVKGKNTNIKITNPEDLVLAKGILSEQ
ncbi:MAG: 2-C-methyl-D-erythritol 4-phosphate cytidylyltransferase [Legionellales bacterium]|nr:2-C-methyl-D-erythritol 4-phosphate cytidylyltransferase [Legionellales bacterium]|tara:strand:- start:862 stop:1536 length:675 start_codon:yes stop_codon:yes gene_type:complete